MELLMSRLNAFRNLKNDAWYGKLYTRLTKLDRELCEDFITTKGNLSKDDFCHAALRFELDQDKSKNHAIIVELLMVSANGAK